MKEADAPTGATYVVVLEIDPDAVRRARAESDVVVGEIMNEPVKLEAALQERSEDIVTGTISVTFETDTTGTPKRRTKITKLTTQRPDGVTETEVISESIERRPIAGSSTGQ